MFKSFINKLAEAINNSKENFESDKPHSIEILKHSKNYSKLLDSYVVSAQQNMTMKKWFKLIFFAVTICSFIAVVYFFYLALQYAINSFDKYDNLNSVTTEAILSIISVLIPAISSLIVAFIKLPEIIAQYLFNAEEDNNMNLVIKNIQDYDKAMFSMEQKIGELLMNNKDQSEEVKDEDIEESPTANTN